MSDLALKVENLGKRFRGSCDGARPAYSTLREEVLSLPRRWRGRREPENEAWALRGVSFELRKGEVLGVVGRNGAGKSTLLKILSRIMEPTEGKAEMRGRVGALLEVGTGFHPELTGRENVFLSGALLGMRRAEVRARLDEIVAFAGTEDALDRPVKHYSSGMQARLGFAVAAHLEPEILIIDEVLGVGDVRFQERCLRKVRDISSREGRTVLIVSHQMAIMQSLCSRGLLLRGGRVAAEGDLDACIRGYLEDADAQEGAVLEFDMQSGQAAGFVGLEFRGEDGAPAGAFAFGEIIELRLRVRVRETLPDYLLGFSINTPAGLVVACSNHHDALPRGELGPGTHVFVAKVAGLFLAPGEYRLTVALSSGDQLTSHHFLPDCATFRVEERSPSGRPYGSHFDNRPGLLRPPFAWRRTEET